MSVAWTVYDSVERLEVPDDLQAALGKNKKAKENFDAFPDSSKKNILWWLKSAKSDATRRKRLDKTVSMAAEGKRATTGRLELNDATALCGGCAQLLHKP